MESPDGKTLVIAEKPSVAADLAKVLKVPKSGEVFENDAYVVSSAVGHLAGLLEPDALDAAWKAWSLARLPILPDSFDGTLTRGILVSRDERGSKDRLRLLARLLSRKDVACVVNACDAGREGELIFHMIAVLADSKLPEKRLWLTSMTPGAIKAAFEKLLDASAKAGLRASSICRSQADWLIGMNMTRAATGLLRRRDKGVYSVGRVQTPTLMLLVKRETEIRDFKKRPFWRVEAEFSVAAGTYKGAAQVPGVEERKEAERFYDEAQAKALAEDARRLGKGVVVDERKPKKESPPRLFDLTSLQREANKRFGFSAKTTLGAAQSLYESKKALTYPRTDSQYLPEDYVSAAKNALKALAKHPAGPFAAQALEKGWVDSAGKRVFDSKKVSDHFAIVPTGAEAQGLSEPERKIYDLVVKRFVAVFFPPAEFEETVRVTTVGEHRFRTAGKVLAVAGWRAVWGQEAEAEDDKDKEGSASLPAIGPADGAPPEAKVKDVSMKRDETKPPPRYNEATLLGAMENAGRLVDDEALAEAMKERGLGTPATRAATIENLIEQKYIERKGKELAPCPKAFELAEFLSGNKLELLADPVMTGEWELRLREMEKGRLAAPDFISGIKEQVRGMVDKVKAAAGNPQEPEPLEPVVLSLKGTPMLFDGTRYLSAETLPGKRAPEVVVYREVGGRTISPEELAVLLKERRIGPFSDFKSRTSGRSYSASIKLEEKDGQLRSSLEFVPREGAGGGAFDPAWPVLGKCPISGLPVQQTPAAGYRVCPEKAKAAGAAATFSLSAELLKASISPDDVTALLSSGRTPEKRFVSKKTGRPFTAYLAVDKAKGWTWGFPPRPAKG